MAKKDDFLNFLGTDDADQGEMMGVISGFIEAANHNTKMAIDLTKLIVENTSLEKRTEEQIFALFKKSSKVLLENYTLKEMLEEIGMN